MCSLKLLVLLAIFSAARGGNRTVPRSGVRLVTGGSDTHNRDHSKNIVSIRFGSPLLFWGDNHGCGGTFIAADLVLTAAHCLYNRMTHELRRPDEFTLVAGSPYRLKEIPTTVELKVRRVIAHERYESRGLPRHDIGIVKLEQRAAEVFKKSAEILPLNESPLEADTRCTVVGWGDFFNEGFTSPVLLYANVTVWSLIECKVQNPIVFLFSGVICANDEEDAHMAGSTCYGDSGGPLICDGRLAGVVSGGPCECGRKGCPGLYTDVYYHRRWIEANSAIELWVPPSRVVAIAAMLLHVNFT